VWPQTDNIEIAPFGYISIQQLWAMCKISTVDLREIVHCDIGKLTLRSKNVKHNFCHIKCWYIARDKTDWLLRLDVLKLRRYEQCERTISTFINIVYIY
jgi:hypothetical protein